MSERTGHKFDLRAALSRYFKEPAPPPAFGAPFSFRKIEVPISPTSRFYLTERDDSEVLRYTLSLHNRNGFRRVVYENNHLVLVEGFGRVQLDMPQREIAKRMFHAFGKAARREVS